MQVRPTPPSTLVSMWPSRIVNTPGNFAAHDALADGQYWRALPSIAVTGAMWAARPADWRNDWPGQVRSCTHRNMSDFCSAAAMRSDCDCPLHDLSATPE